MSLTYIREYADDGALYSEANASPGNSLVDLLDRERPSIKVALELGAAIAEMFNVVQKLSHAAPAQTMPCSLQPTPNASL